MKNYAKVGNRNGRPAYRTPSVWRIKKHQAVGKAKAAFLRRRPLNRGKNF